MAAEPPTLIPLDAIPRRVPCYGPDGEQSGTAIVSAAVVPPRDAKSAC